MEVGASGITGGCRSRFTFRPRDAKQKRRQVSELVATDARPAALSFEVVLAVLLGRVDRPLCEMFSFFAGKTGNERTATWTCFCRRQCCNELYPHMRLARRRRRRRRNCENARKARARKKIEVEQLQEQAAQLKEEHERSKEDAQAAKDVKAQAVSSRPRHTDPSCSTGILYCIPLSML